MEIHSKAALRVGKELAAEMADARLWRAWPPKAGGVTLPRGAAAPQPSTGVGQGLTLAESIPDLISPPQQSTAMLSFCTQMPASIESQITAISASKATLVDAATWP